MRGFFRWTVAFCMGVTTLGCDQRLESRQQNSEGQKNTTTQGCTTTPRYALRRVLPQTGTLAQLSPQLWELTGAGACTGRYRVWITETDVRDFAEPINFVRSYITVGAQKERVRVAALDAAGVPGAPEYVESEAFTVTALPPGGGLVCRATITPPIQDITLPQGQTTFTPPARVDVTLSVERNGVTVPGRLMSLSHPQLAPGLSLPTASSNSHAFSFAPSSIGPQTVVAQIEEVGGIGATQSCVLNYEIRGDFIVPPTATLTIDGQGGVKYWRSAQGAATLTWASTHATQCTLANPTRTGTSGTVSISPAAGATTYSLSCTGAGGTVTATLKVLVDVTMIFATRSTWTGNLGGMSGAHTKCQNAATAAGMTGTWQALISRTGVNVKDALTGTAPLYMLNGERVAASPAALWSTGVERRVEFDETGVRNQSWHLVWTGTRANGMAYSDQFNGGHCSQWTSTSGGAETGRVDRSDTGWVAIYEGGQASNACSNPGRLYCYRLPL